MIRTGDIVTAPHALYTPTSDWVPPVRIPVGTRLRVFDVDEDIKYGYVVLGVRPCDRPWLTTWVNARAVSIVEQARPEPPTIPPPSQAGA